jgi:AraC family transcriptional regulator of adaptative response/methylated-DNA-[protein]-cysteine methyltransferase
MNAATRNAELGAATEQGIDAQVDEASEEIRYSTGECVLGIVLVAKSERGVCAILLGDDADELASDLQHRFPPAKLGDGGTELKQLVSKLAKFLASPAMGLDVPLDVRGTAFQQRVWEALQEIPVGSTESYTEVAGRLGLLESAREVAEACSANALAVAIPCHRVVRKDGGLSGYRWGVKRKRALLQRESVSGRIRRGAPALEGALSFIAPAGPNSRIQKQDPECTISQRRLNFNHENR